MTETTVTTTPPPSQELAPRPFAPELDRYARLGMWLAAAETKDPTPEQRGAAAALRLAYAEQLNLPLLAATELSIIAGRLVVSAQLLRALAEQRGYRTERVDSTDSSCTARLWHEGQPLGETTFTIEDARQAGLIRDRSAWKTHPARMLWARASANVIKDFAPAVALGLITDDEAAEITTPPGSSEVRAPIVIGPEVDPFDTTDLEPDPEPGPDFGPAADTEDSGYPYSGLEQEPPQDQLHTQEPVGSSFETPDPKPASRDDQPATKAQRDKINDLLGKLEAAKPDIYNTDTIRLQLRMEYRVVKVSELTRKQARDLQARLERKVDQLL